MWASLAANMSRQDAASWSEVSEVTVVLAATILVLGLIGEFPDSEKWHRTCWYRLAKCAVIGGVIFETVGGIGAFVTSVRLQELTDRSLQDQLTIQKEQQDKIRALSARPWTQKQFDAIQTLKGTAVKDVAVIPQDKCAECKWYAGEIETALHAAGVTLYDRPIRPFPLLDSMEHVGIFVWVTPGHPVRSDPLALALEKGGMLPLGPVGARQDTIADWPFKPNVWVISVGERAPLLPEEPYAPDNTGSYPKQPLEK
jgi:hypothetical protein